MIADDNQDSYLDENNFNLLICPLLKNFATALLRLSRHHFTTSPLRATPVNDKSCHLTPRSPIFSTSFSKTHGAKIVGLELTNGRFSRSMRTERGENHAPRRPIKHYLLRSRVDENSARSDPSAAASSSYIVRAEPFPAHSPATTTSRPYSSIVR